MGLRTTVVGSWWKRDEHEDDLARYHRGELFEADGEALLQRAAAAAIAEQRDLGLDEWTGGEYFTDNFIDHMQRVLSGLEVDKPDECDPFDYDDLAHAVITSELSAPDGLGYARAYRREQALPGGVRKATVVGPWRLRSMPRTSTQSCCVRCRTWWRSSIASCVSWRPRAVRMCSWTSRYSACSSTWGR